MSKVFRASMKNGIIQIVEVDLKSGKRKLRTIRR